MVNHPDLGVFQYDAEGRITQATAGSPTITTTYEYDGDGRRVRKIVAGGGTTVFVYDVFGQLAAEYGTVAATPTPQYVTTDYLGHVRAVTDGAASPAVVARRDYYPFGETIPSGLGGRSAVYSAAWGTTMGFGGKERDGETATSANAGLDYFGARYYGSTMYRFGSPDEPLVDQSARDPQSWNLYGFVRSNPLRFTDPTGMKCIDGIDDKTKDACFEVTGTLKREGGIISGFFRTVANLFIGAYNLTGDIAEQVDGIPNGQYTYHKVQPYEMRSTSEDRGAIIATATTLLVAGPERMALAATEIRFSSLAVHSAAAKLLRGLPEVRVATKSQAEELFLRLYQGAGYRNTTGMHGNEVRGFFGSKNGTYHWDTKAGHGPMNPHGNKGPHLQIHGFDGRITRIYYGP